MAIFNSLTHSLTVVSPFPPSFIHALVHSLALFLTLSFSFFLSFTCFFSPILIHLFAFSFTRSRALLFGLHLSLACFLPSSLFHSLSHVLTQNWLIHSPTHSFVRFLTSCSLACPIFASSFTELLFAHSLAFFPLYSLTCSIACFVPPPLLSHWPVHLFCCLPPFLTRPFIHLLAHIHARLLPCSLPSSLTSYHTSLLSCFLFFLPPLSTHSFVRLLCS